MIFSVFFTILYQGSTPMKQLKFILAFLVVAVIVLSGIRGVFAHERRELENNITLVFGWREEPAYTGLFNGPEIFVRHTDTEESIEGAELQAEVTFGDQTKVLTFRQAFGEPGHYVAELMPMLPGDYSFHVTGTVGDVQIDEVFTSADGEFGSVEPITDIMFPVLENMTIQELAERIANLEVMITEIQAALDALQGE
jgi:hypothetical protein